MYCNRKPFSKNVLGGNRVMVGAVGEEDEAAAELGRGLDTKRVGVFP